MTYKDLLEELKELTPEELNRVVRIFNCHNEKLYYIKSFEKVCDDNYLKPIHEIMIKKIDW